MDYKELLIKYMKLVENVENVTFFEIYYANKQRCETLFTDKEIEVLKEIENKFK